MAIALIHLSLPAYDSWSPPGGNAPLAAIAAMRGIGLLGTSCVPSHDAATLPAVPMPLHVNANSGVPSLLLSLTSSCANASVLPFVYCLGMVSLLDDT